MGRNYIGERTIADPREKAANKVRKKRQEVKRQRAERAALAAYIERSRWCRRKGCEQLAVGGEGGWWPCCSEACHQAWFDSLPEGRQ